MKSRPAWWLLVLAIPVGCQKTTTVDNPITLVNDTRGPSADADLLVLQSPDAATAVREVFALDVDSSAAPVRLTGCAGRQTTCDIVEVAPAPDRQHVVTRRRTDSNGDGRIDAADAQTTVVTDLLRGVEGEILIGAPPPNSLVWTNDDLPLYFSAAGVNGLDDIYQSPADGTASVNISSSADTRERHPRIKATLLIFEHGEPGKISEVWGSVIGLGTARIATGDPAIEPLPLPGTDYLLGSDADGEPSPDLTQVVFRRLTGVGDGRGTWDIMTVGVNGTNPQTVASGGAFRGEPTWGQKGIAFVESAVGAKTSSLVLIDPAGARKVLVADAPLTLQSPRWLGL